jgi:hypothetical protein
MSKGSCLDATLYDQICKNRELHFAVRLKSYLDVQQTTGWFVEQKLVLRYNFKLDQICKNLELKLGLTYIFNKPCSSLTVVIYNRANIHLSITVREVLKNKRAYQ